MSANPIVDSFFHAVTKTWTHLATDPATQIAAIIDPVLDFELASGRVWTDTAEQLFALVRERALRVEWILETHTHADHLSAAYWLKDALGAKGIAPKIAIGAGIVDVQKHFGQVFGLGPDFAANGSPFDCMLRDGEQFRIGNLEVRVIATPGHTMDSISYLIGDAVFVGDTLFAPRAGTGRCDFPGGNATAQYRSIKRLYDLPNTTRVFLCHDYPAADAQPLAQTTIAAEKAGNIQLTGMTSESDYVALRAGRDATLSVPAFLYPSLRVNIHAGRLPPADDAGNVFVRVTV